MSEGRSPEFGGSTPLSEMTWIDQLCDAFEHAWRQGESPRIVDYLEPVSEPLRSKLFEELLISDLEFLTRDGSTINMQDYLTQFPDRSQQIRCVIERFWAEQGTPRGATGFVEASESPATGIGHAVLQECGSYRQLEEIARGGMGVVYRAHDMKLQRTVALKMILDRNLASAEAVQRFYAEAEMAASLTHPGIVPIYDVGSHAGYHYYVMAYVEGPTLAAELRRRRFGMEESAQMILDLALAVAHAHEQGVVHRDLKPGNILLPRNGPPQITDFGLAKRTDSPGQLTVAGQVLGTPGYMAPEQAAGDTEQSGPAVDVYALGALLYHLMTGHPPFRTAIEALVCVLEQDPVPPRTMNRRVPRDLNVICMKCLSKNPVDRYRSAQDLADDLRRYLHGDLIHAKPQSLRRRLIRWSRHRPRLAAVIVTMLAFYLYHLACMASGNPGSFGLFNWLATLTTGLVCTYAWLFQSRIMRPRARSALLYWWVATDIIVLTLFLLFPADGANSPLVVIYLCMVASAALSFDRHMVWLVTAGCVASYALVVVVSPVLHPALPLVPIRNSIPAAISILAIGLIQYYVLRCCRVQMAPLPHHP